MDILLNDDLFNIILKYLLNKNIKYLSDTCTRLRKYKFKNIMIFNKCYSKKYYDDIQFRQYVLEYMKIQKTKYLDYKLGFIL